MKNKCACNNIFVLFDLFRFEDYVREWMKNIYEVLLESEQLRLETDNAGPQDELEYWKSRAARLSLLVDQISSMPCKMTVVTLKVAQCRLIKVGVVSYKD